MSKSCQSRCNALQNTATPLLHLHIAYHRMDAACLLCARAVIFRAVIENLCVSVCMIYTHTQVHTHTHTHTHTRKDREIHKDSKCTSTTMSPPRPKFSSIPHLHMHRVAAKIHDLLQPPHLPVDMFERCCKRNDMDTLALRAKSCNLERVDVHARSLLFRLPHWWLSYDKLFYLSPTHHCGHCHLSKSVFNEISF